MTSPRGYFGQGLVFLCIEILTEVLSRDKMVQIFFFEANMQDYFEIVRKDTHTFTELMSALEMAATGHAKDLGIAFPNMLEKFGALWMIVRCRLCLARNPKGDVRVKTWLRTPNAAVSNRDFALFDEDGEFGEAVQSWVLVDAEKRSIINMKKIPPLWSLPTPKPERTQVLKHISLPEMQTVEAWTITADELDLNGHLNNVRYIRKAEKYTPEGALNLDVIYDRECFAGETLTLQAKDGFVCGIKDDGSFSFRAHFYKGEPL